MVERVDADDADVRAFVGAHRHLFVPLDELTRARDALARHVRDAKLRANPLFIDLEDEGEAKGAAAAPVELDRLRDRRREAEAALERSAYVSADGRTQVLAIRTAFRATDIALDRRLMTELEAIAAGLRAVHPEVEIGFTGGVPTTLAEHAALVRGIIVSSLITALLVALVLFAYLRSLRLLVLVTVNIAVGTLVALGAAALTVGHLNAATAFLGAIIAGNGVNYGIVLVARFLEERRDHAPEVAMARAITGTVTPTLIASIGAAIAYGALAATEFRGFADFALIGGVGMLVCWATSFVLLPVLVLGFAHGGRAPSPWFGRLVVALFAVRRPALAAAVTGVIVVASGVVAWRFIADDPYEYDMTALRSRAPDARAARAWMRVSDEAVGRGLAGIGGQTYVALDDAAQVPAVVAAVRQRAAVDPIVGAAASILDVVPADQGAKLAVLADLRGSIDEIAAELAPADRDELLALRPPDDLRAVTVADLPASIAGRLVERDGRIGLIVAVKPGPAFDEHDGRDLIAFATAVRGLRRAGDPVPAVGASVMFADVLLQIQEDGPVVTWIAALGIAIMVLLVAGWSRRAAAALIATFAGSLVMVAACALGGLRITFLDFVALPITLGLGVDYAINVAARATEGDPVAALRSTGGAVLVCSLTTVIGYASLLASDNLAIRGFGIASLLGEVTCMVAAFVIVPAVMAFDLRRPIPMRTRHRAGFGARSFADLARHVDGSGRTV